MRWIVRPGDGRNVREILERAGADKHAIADGRVFVGVRRVRSDGEPVMVGDAVSVSVPQAAPSSDDLVLVCTADLVAVNKPAGIPTIADHGGASHALVPLVARHLGIDASRVHATSRLDREVSGVVILALDRSAASRMLRARERGEYQRRYVAIAQRAPEVERGVWDAPIGRARDPRLRVVNGRDRATAQTRFSVCARAAGGEAMLAVAPVTGRTHQIRVHAAHAGAPLLGDVAYGGPARQTLPSGRVVEPRRIALHAARVDVRDEEGVAFTASAPVPVELEALWSALGGDPKAWDLCATCILDSR